MSALLDVNNVRAGYGRGPDILDGLSLEIERNKSYCIIGPNGAGKSTLFKAICGFLPLREGHIKLNGDRIDGLRPDQILKRGLSLVQQDTSLFPEMTVKENLQMGGYTLSDQSKTRERIDEVVDIFPVLKERFSNRANTLSGGQQKMLVIARALILEPEIMMLDEPSMGLAPKIVEDIFEVIQTLKDMDITIVMIEQNAHRGLQHVDYGIVLDLGQKSFEAPADQVLDNPKIRESYLGKSRGKQSATSEGVES